MPSRRRNPRYRLSAPLKGTVFVAKDLAVEQRTDREVTVLSDAPAAGQDLTLDLIGSGRPVTLSVRVAESTPVIIDGAVQYRLRLTIVR